MKLEKLGKEGIFLEKEFVIRQPLLNLFISSNAITMKNTLVKLKSWRHTPNINFLFFFFTFIRCFNFYLVPFTPSSQLPHFPRKIFQGLCSYKMRYILKIYFRFGIWLFCFELRFPDSTLFRFFFSSTFLFLSFFQAFPRSRF